MAFLLFDLATSPPRHLATSPPRHLATSPPRHLATSPPKRFASKTVSDITFLRLFLRLKAIILTAFFFCSGLFVRDVYYPHRNVSICFPVT
ncbi:hypothetical protein CTM70_10735 [Photobacterium phosphoreum]|nr:hypothetical protein CTM70_10735 [Photobacterium phosphoreum]